ncbi:MAG TPA: diadenylate cyclase CdaA [Polyangiaceae bacterium]|nr:diadenylate cyclase CdaA [Polyangiaceae bacterium]
MLEHLIQYLTDRSLGQMARDAVDILLVYYVSYRALLVLRGTRAMQVGLGLALVFVFFLVAQWLQLVTVVSILGELITSIILVIVVVFQNDIRRGLMRVGSRAWLSGWSRARETKVIDEVVEAATELARHRIGAIITFEQEANLDEFVGSNKGINIDAEMSSELLVSLFIPEGMNKLHDGAVIVRNLRIAKAGVFFPMPEGKVIDASFGSRHRASIGITEETDAVVVVVSEERGTISFVFNGNIASNLDGPKLRAMLEAIFSPKFRSKKPKKDRRSTLPSVISEAVAETETEPEAVPVEETPEPPESEPRARESEAPPAPLRQRSVAEETPPPSRATSIRTPVSGRPPDIVELAPESARSPAPPTPLRQRSVVEETPAPAITTPLSVRPIELMPASPELSSGDEEDGANSEPSPSRGGDA